MPQHEDKTCPRCQQPFECKVGSILLCQCSSVSLSEAERAFLGKHYTDCLCTGCIKELQHAYQVQKFTSQMNSLLEKRGF